jgi:hypothetical protein
MGGTKGLMVSVLPDYLMGHFIAFWANRNEMRDFPNFPSTSSRPSFFNEKFQLARISLKYSRHGHQRP